MVTQSDDAPYIASHRPEPPSPSPMLKARHYHLAYEGERGKAVTQARWSLPEDAGMWAVAFRSPPEGDEAAIYGHHYLTQSGMNPASGQAQRCKGGRGCPARDPAAGTWLPIIGRIVLVA